MWLRTDTAGDLGVRSAVGHLDQNLAFSFGERGQEAVGRSVAVPGRCRVWELPTERVQQSARHAGGHHRITGGNRRIAVTSPGNACICGCTLSVHRRCKFAASVQRRHSTATHRGSTTPIQQRLLHLFRRCVIAVPYTKIGRPGDQHLRGSHHFAVERVVLPWRVPAHQPVSGFSEVIQITRMARSAVHDDFGAGNVTTQPRTVGRRAEHVLLPVCHPHRHSNLADVEAPTVDECQVVVDPSPDSADQRAVVVSRVSAAMS